MAQLSVRGFTAAQLTELAQVAQETQGQSDEQIVEVAAQRLPWFREQLDRIPSDVKRTGVARRPLRQGEKLREGVEEQLVKLQQLPPCPLIFQLRLSPILTIAEYMTPTDFISVR
jgi:hypothetical protein